MTQLKPNNSDIYVFYHLFMVGKWGEIWTYHLSEIIEAGLYDSCEEIKIGLVYKSTGDLEEFRTLIRQYPKVSILYSRYYKELPATIWKDPELKVKTQLGEGETILKMAEYVQKIENDELKCLFFHSKGVTKPNNKKRSQIRYFFEKGLPETADEEAAQDFILKDMTYESITKWEEKSALLNKYSFYYYIWNFFWISGEMLKAFDIREFNKRGPYPQKNQFRGRHHTAIFPINLYIAQSSESLTGIKDLIGFCK